MIKPPPVEQLGPIEGRLDSWKKIAGYLKRDVTTAQRWEKREGMPVHRQVHDKMGSVYAFRSELDDWMRSRTDPTPVNSSDIEPSNSAASPPTGTSSIVRVRWAAIIAVAALTALVTAVILEFERNDHFWHNPIAEATYQPVTGFEGENEAAAVSRDGQFIAFLSNRGGRTDVWVTQLGSGQFHNLTQGIDGEFVNPSIRPLSFSPDGSLVTFWLRTPSRPASEAINVWSVPTLGGEPRPYLEGVAEVAWSPNGSRLAYHTPGPGDPLYVTDGTGLSRNPPLLMAPSGEHLHFPVWASDDLVYFVKGTLPDQLDVWRASLHAKAPERITSPSARVTYPVLLDRNTLLYLATAADGSGPWVYGMDVERRVPHRLTSGVEEYTSLAASANGRRLIATVSEPEPTLWKVALAQPEITESRPERIALATGTGSAPRLARNYMIYVASTATGDSIWKIAGSSATQLWAGTESRIIGNPAISSDDHAIAFSVKGRGTTQLFTMESDGSRLKPLATSLTLRGSPAWAPDGASVTSAADEIGGTHLLRIPLDGKAPTALTSDYSTDPTWSPDGQFVIYSGPDVGTTFRVRASGAHELPPLELTRGARHLAWLPGGHKLVVLKGELQHKDLWAIDLQTGSLQQLTRLAPDFDVRDFDIASDGRTAIFERAQPHSRVVAIDRAPN